MPGTQSLAFSRIKDTRIDKRGMPLQSHLVSVPFRESGKFIRRKHIWNRTHTLIWNRIQIRPLGLSFHRTPLCGPLGSYLLRRIYQWNRCIIMSDYDCGWLVFGQYSFPLYRWNRYCFFWSIRLSSGFGRIPVLEMADCKTKPHELGANEDTCEDNQRAAQKRGQLFHTRNHERSCRRNE